MGVKKEKGEKGKNGKKEKEKKEKKGCIGKRDLVWFLCLIIYPGLFNAKAILVEEQQ